jgi:hypothetical protein
MLSLEVSREKKKTSQRDEVLVAMLGIRDILVRTRMRIRILGSVPLTNGSGCGSGRPENIRIIRIRIQNTGAFTSFFKDKKSHKIITKQ